MLTVELAHGVGHLLRVGVLVVLVVVAVRLRPWRWLSRWAQSRG